MTSKSSFHTYFHTRNDTGAVFYVGKGTEKRAYSCGRNAHWDRINAKHGRAVHIAAKWSTEAEAFEHEKFLILCFKDMGVPLCNLTDGGEGSTGWKPNQKNRETTSRVSKQRWSDPAYKTAVVEKMRKAAEQRVGWKHSDESRKKMSDSHLGKPLTDAAREKLIGRPMSAKLKEKLKLANTGRIVSEEARDRMSAARTGKIVSEETKERMRKAQTGKVRTEAHRTNMAAAIKAQWVIRKQKKNDE